MDVKLVYFHKETSKIVGKKVLKYPSQSFICISATSLTNLSLFTYKVLAASFDINLIFFFLSPHPWRKVIITSQQAKLT